MSSLTLERAFQLAREGSCTSMSDLVRALKSERLDGVDAHLAGPSLRGQLSALMTQARKERGKREADEPS